MQYPVKNFYFIPSLIRAVPSQLTECLLYIASLLLIAGGVVQQPDTPWWVCLCSALLLPAAVLYSAEIREVDFWRRNPHRMLQMLAVLWGQLALLLRSPLPGVMAAVALLALVGCFAGRLYPLNRLGSTRQRGHLEHVALGGALLLALYALLQQAAAPLLLQVFADGLYWLGGVALFGALLLVSSYAYCRGQHYLLTQWRVMLAGLLVWMLGIGGAIAGLQPMASVFLSLYLLLKPLDWCQARR